MLNWAPYVHRAGHISQGELTAGHAFIHSGSAVELPANKHTLKIKEIDKNHKNQEKCQKPTTERQRWVRTPKEDQTGDGYQNGAKVNLVAVQVKWKGGGTTTMRGNSEGFSDPEEET